MTVTVEWICCYEDFGENFGVPCTCITKVIRIVHTNKILSTIALQILITVVLYYPHFLLYLHYL
jgi:hypothetical protein